MSDWYIYSLSGLAVGFIVGMTGVGGGSLMTPILVYLGIPPLKAVGTDLLYASITKAGGIFVHQQKRSIDWKITGWMSVGSLPAALITVLWLNAIGVHDNHAGDVIKTALGFALLLTAVAMLAKNRLLAFASKHGNDRWHQQGRTQIIATIITGVILGVLVSLSSIGAGAIGTIALFLLYPMLPTVKIVGSDLAHAVPLTLVAGLGHLAIGSVNLPLLLSLLIGSLPGIYIGSHLSSRVPDKLLRTALASMMAIIGTTMIWPVLH